MPATTSSPRPPPATASHVSVRGVGVPASPKVAPTTDGRPCGTDPVRGCARLVAPERQGGARPARPRVGQAGTRRALHRRGRQRHRDAPVRREVRLDRVERARRARAASAKRAVASLASRRVTIASTSGRHVRVGRALGHAGDGRGDVHAEQRHLARVLEGAGARRSSRTSSRRARTGRRAGRRAAPAPARAPCTRECRRPSRAA